MKQLNLFPEEVKDMTKTSNRFSLTLTIDGSVTAVYDNKTAKQLAAMVRYWDGREIYGEIVPNNDRSKYTFKYSYGKISLVRFDYGVPYPIAEITMHGTQIFTTHKESFGLAVAIAEMYVGEMGNE